MKLALSPPLREAALPPTAMGAWTVPHEWWDEGHGCQPCPDTGRLEGKGNRVSPLRMAAFQGNAFFFVLKRIHAGVTSARWLGTHPGRQQVVAHEPGPWPPRVGT